MTSKSRITQESLGKLEKDSAPIDDQLVEAAKFIAFDPESDDDLDYDAGEKTTSSVLYGREEWLLRWLLKKLQNWKEKTARQNATSWRILARLLRVIPATNAAKILVERKFMSILRQTLVEAQEISSVEKLPGLEPKKGEKSKASKKRKRSGELVDAATSENVDTSNLLVAIHVVVKHMVTSTKTDEAITDLGLSAAFSPEYMKTVLRTTGEDVAKILGIWLFLSQEAVTSGTVDAVESMTWISPFIEIWELRIPGAEDAMNFSLYSLRYLLELLQKTKSPDGKALLWGPELEQLLARNIIIPAKAAHAEDPDSELLGSLTKLSVLQSSANAPILFEIAILSLQPHGARRSVQDDVWLQAAFTTLKAAMLANRPSPNGEALQSMLQSAIQHKVQFEMSTLRSIATEYAIPAGITNWSLLSTLIKLDANVFLIPNEEKDLLKDILGRITEACVTPAWPELYDEVVPDVVVPLMKEFAQRRDLSGFIKHWFSQLVKFEILRAASSIPSTDGFSAWEADALQEELAKLLEPSLTTKQTLQLLEWLDTEVQQHPDAVCTIIEAVCHGIKKESWALVDAVGNQPHEIMCEAYLKLNDRYKWRYWRLLSRIISWDASEQFRAISGWWMMGTMHSMLPGIDWTGNIDASLESVECLRFIFATWKCAAPSSPTGQLLSTTAANYLKSVARHVKTLLGHIQSERDLGEQILVLKQNTLSRDFGWTAWAFIRCVFVEYPEVLRLGTKLQHKKFLGMLQNIFWISSANNPPSTESNLWLNQNPEAFTSLWKTLMDYDFQELDQEWLDIALKMLLSSLTHTSNPLINGSDVDDLAVYSLRQLPLELFSRGNREQIMTFSWASTAVDVHVLSLKVRMMKRRVFYDDMRFNDLVQLADGIADSKTDSLNASLSLFKELAKRTLTHMTANLDQSRDKAYTLEALEYIKYKTRVKVNEKSKSKDCWNFALVALFEIVLAVLATKKNILDDLSIISIAELTSITVDFTHSLISTMHKSLLKKKFKSEHQKLSMLYKLDALEVLGFDRNTLNSLSEDADAFIESVKDENVDLAVRLEDFMAQHIHDEDDDPAGLRLVGSVDTIHGRQSLFGKAQTIAKSKDSEDKLELLASICKEVTSQCPPDQLLSAYHVMKLCADKKRDDDDDDDLFDLSSAYAYFCSRSSQTSDILQFSLLTETLAEMLLTKPRAISQWNLDSTLGVITIICSRNSPKLRSTQAGNIFLHLTNLLRSFLVSHRLKLQGHFHLLIQAMQALLRCLFTPLAHSARISKTFAPPPWLGATQRLGAAHAEAYTRLLTLICDPSVSSVTRSRHNSLTNEIEKAKRIAGQHMRFVLASYIQCQLEMRMSSEVREKLKLGIYAIFDATTLEGRQIMNESLDSSGRAVFAALHRDWKKFGKWEGS